MKNVDEEVLKEVVDFFLGLELKNLQELKKMAGKSEEEVYKYLNGEVFICCNR